MTEHTPSESLVLRHRDRIIERLRLLERHGIVLDAVFAEADNGMTVMVEGIFPERGLLAVSTTAGSARRRRLLEADRVDFTGYVDGVRVCFEAAGIREATFQGREVLAVPIPETMVWRQQRRFFRVFVPSDQSVRCRLTFPDGESRWFDAINLSIRGVALLDRSGRLHDWERGRIFENCRLDLPGFQDERVDLEIRGMLETSGFDTRNPVLRVGCAFRHIEPRLETKIQRLLNELETRGRQKRIRV